MKERRPMMSARDELLSAVPAYDRFLTLAELDESTRRLAAEYPDRVRVRTIGQSAEGRDLLCLTLGDGPKHALMIGCLDPGGPAGAMAVEFLSRFFCERTDILRATGYAWHMIKAADPDGVRRNEGWFSGPYSLYARARSCYRPAGRTRVERTFPSEYKTLRWASPLPETRALMRLIDEVHPSLLVLPQGGGLGGARWHVTDADAGLVRALHRAAGRHGIPLSLGEPEMPCVTPLDKAVFRFSAFEDGYEFCAQMLPGTDPAAVLAQGDSAVGYANRSGRTCFGIAAEAPSFFHPGVADERPAGRSRKASLRLRCEKLEAVYAFLAQALAKIRPLLPEEDAYTAALDECVRLGAAGVAAMRAFAGSDPALEAAATRAQDFGNAYGLPAMHLSAVGMLLGACGQRFLSATGEDAFLLAAAWDEIDAFLRDAFAGIERDIQYAVTPVRKLVSLQAECALAAVCYADGRLDEWV